MSTPANLDQLESLIEQQKWSEAKFLLEAYFNGHDTPQEIGKAYLDFAEVYLEVMTKYKKQQLEMLQTGVEVLEKLDKTEQAALDVINLKKTRDQLKK